ncbi:MAG: DUF5082 family protein [Hespellia sp.]|nr:DUF5082 family protein [Hespellia sp.]
MSDIDALYYQRTMAQRQMQEYQQKCSELDEKIERLRTAKESVASYKNTVRSMRGTVAGYMSVESWKGQNYTKYQEAVRDGLTQGFNEYYNQVDNAQDELNLEMARLQNEKSSTLGWLGNVTSTLNNIQTAIRNALN